MPPTPVPLSWLIVNNRGLRVECADCGRRKVYGSLEACARFGGDIRFEELRQIIWNRCAAKTGCRAVVAPLPEGSGKGGGHAG